MVYNILAIAITLLISFFVLWGVFPIIKINNKISNYDFLFTFSYKVYFANFFLWVIYFACVGFLNKGKYGEWFYWLLFVVPFYVIISGIATYFKINKIDKTEETKTFFKKMQVVFEIIFSIVTVSLLLATLSGMSSKPIQAGMLVITLGMYTPVVPILGALKYYNA